MLIFGGDSEIVNLDVIRTTVQAVVAAVETDLELVILLNSPGNNTILFRLARRCC